ncbi:MAG: hypothetical protein HOL85_04510 [Rhodospirillaceae bacterium]|jgi:hypothetical protein|nr:hypothetical protein [Rhodospirillaceae bacterium]MBT6136624.1 hypothetical protein [Rhodospirillaceae bacterium]
MTLDEFLMTIAKSSADDWRVTDVPTFMYRIVPVRGPGSAKQDFEIQEHNVMMTYTKDITIGMAFGMVIDRNYSESWLDGLANQRAEAIVCDFLYSGALVFRERFVAVDGWRCIMPQPVNSDGPPHRVPHGRLLIAKLVHTLVGPGTSFDSYLKRLAIEPSKDPWP